MNILIRLSVSLRVKIKLMNVKYFPVVCRMQQCASGSQELHYMFKVKDLIYL